MKNTMKNIVLAIIGTAVGIAIITFLK